MIFNYEIHRYLEKEKGVWMEVPNFHATVTRSPESFQPLFLWLQLTSETKRAVMMMMDIKPGTFIENLRWKEHYIKVANVDKVS